MKQYDHSLYRKCKQELYIKINLSIMKKQLTVHENTMNSTFILSLLLCQWHGVTMWTKVLTRDCLVVLPLPCSWPWPYIAQHYTPNWNTELNFIWDPRTYEPRRTAQLRHSSPDQLGHGDHIHNSSNHHIRTNALESYRLRLQNQYHP